MPTLPPYLDLLDRLERDGVDPPQLVGENEPFRLVWRKREAPHWYVSVHVGGERSVYIVAWWINTPATTSYGTGEKEMAVDYLHEQIKRLLA